MMKERASNGGGCLGCATVLALLVACVFASVHLFGPTTIGRTAQAYAERTLQNLGLNEPKTYDSSTVGYAWYQLDGEGQIDGEGQLDGESQQSYGAGQQAYQTLLEGVQNFEESIVVIGATPSDVEAAYNAMMNDHPELFWLSGSFVYTSPELLDSVTVQPGYEVDPSEVPALRTAIEAEADAILAAVGEGATEYDIARHVYAHIASTTDYEVDSPHNQTIQSVFLNHRSVCAGYARAYQYLLHRAGMECAYVEGRINSSGEEHAWNLARIDGQYTYVDPTWADPTYAGDGAENAPEAVIYDYLCLTTDEILRDDHTFSHPDEWPVCEAADLDFYRREGLYFDGYDEAALSEAFWRQVDAGGTSAGFKFGSDETYLQVVAALDAGEFQRDNLLALASRNGADSIKYSYTTSDGLRIVKLYW